MKQPVERRLAAILAADVAGYSRLTGADEEGTHERLKAHRRELVDPKDRRHRGRIVKTTGDGSRNPVRPPPTSLATRRYCSHRRCRDCHWSDGLVGVAPRNHAVAVPAAPEAALSQFERALELSPQDPNRHWFYSGLGFCPFLGDANEAVNFFRKARATNPRIYYIYIGFAAALGLRGDIDEAKAALAESLQLKPELNSLARLRAFFPPFTPQLEAFAEKTWDVGLRRAGLPEE